jgi:rhodanese-related sulfurtransferase
MAGLVWRVALILGVAAIAAMVHGNVRGMEMPREATGGLPADVQQRLEQAREERLAAAAATPVAEATPVEATPTETVTAAADDEQMTCEDLREAWASGLVTIIDARPTDQYTEAHIPGAYSLPYEDFNSRWPVLSTMIFPQEVIVVYCDGGDCHASDSLASLLLEMGYDNTVVYRLGFESWTAKGYETESGEPMI